MSVAVQLPEDERVSVEAYLEHERRASEKSELRNGAIVAMAGASLAHNRITANLVRAIGNALQGRDCDVLAQDMKARTTARGFAYPDVMIVCGAPEFFDARQDVVLNPTVIIEVLSESTEAYDRGEKFRVYQQRESLREYVLVAQDRLLVERFTRQNAENVWLYERLDRTDSNLELESVGCAVTLSDIYYRVDVSAPKD